MNLYAIYLGGSVTPEWQCTPPTRWLTLTGTVALFAPEYAISLDDKIKDILNKQFRKDFAEAFPMKQQHIKNLKELRNLIVHTKADANYEPYEDLYKRYINFEFDETIEALKAFINFFEEDLIEPCPCGRDF